MLSINSAMHEQRRLQEESAPEGNAATRMLSAASIAIAVPILVEPAGKRSAWPAGKVCALLQKARGANAAQAKIVAPACSAVMVSAKTAMVLCALRVLKMAKVAMHANRVCFARMSFARDRVLDVRHAVHLTQKDANHRLVSSARRARTIFLKKVC